MVRKNRKVVTVLHKLILSLLLIPKWRRPWQVICWIVSTSQCAWKSSITYIVNNYIRASSTSLCRLILYFMGMKELCTSWSRLPYLWIRSRIVVREQYNLPTYLTYLAYLLHPSTTPLYSIAKPSTAPLLLQLQQIYLKCLISRWLSLLRPITFFRTQKTILERL